MGAGQLSLWGAVGSKISECIGNTDTGGLHCRWFICSYTTFLMKLKSEATRHLMALVHMHRLQNPAYYLKHIQGYITDHWGDKIMSHALQGCLRDRDIYNDILHHRRSTQPITMQWWRGIFKQKKMLMCTLHFQSQLGGSFWSLNSDAARFCWTGCRSHQILKDARQTWND